MGALDPAPLTKKAFYDSVLYYGDDSTHNNYAPSTGLSTWSVRDTSTHGFFLDHANIGTVDVCMEIRNTLTAASVGRTLLVTLRVVLDDSVRATGGLRNGPVIWAGSVAADGRWFLVPERGAGVQTTAFQETVAIPELRLPFYRFWMEWTADAAPDAGAVALRVTRRY